MRNRGLVRDLFFVVLLGSLLLVRPCHGGECELCFTAGGCNLHVTSVQLGNTTFDLKGMGKDEAILTVGLSVVSGDIEKVSACRGDVDVWVTDEHGRRNSSRAATTFRNANGEVTSIQWLFAVPKNSKSFCLNFPGGEALDLAPFFE
jgi:hypothetical protein